MKNISDFTFLDRITYYQRARCKGVKLIMYQHIVLKSDDMK